MRALLVTGTAVAISACEPGAVVSDPLPPPLRCSSDPSTYDYFYRLRFDFTWRAVGPGFVIEVELSVLGSRSEDDGFAFRSDPVARGAVVQGIRRHDGGLRFILVPGKDAPQVGLTIPLDCSGIDDALYLRLDLRDRPGDGLSVPFEIIDPQHEHDPGAIY